MKFTPRERVIVACLADGKTNEEIAEATKHTTHTVETYRTRMLKKHRAKNSPHLVSIAYKRGILTIKP